MSAMESITGPGQLTLKQRDQIRAAYEEEARKPLSIAVMGQTGVGKSSLLNALFNVKLEVGDVRPTTMIPEPVTVPGDTSGEESGAKNVLIFWDMPGIGESKAADAQYLSWYREKLTQCDVVLWAMHADSRSTLTDSTALQTLLDDTTPDERRRLFSKITFVLTKADLLTPPPWIYFRENEVNGRFAPSPKIREKLDEKALFYQESLIEPHGGLGSTWTFIPDGFSMTDPQFRYDDLGVEYLGYMSNERCAAYNSQYPMYTEVFERLRDNHTVIPCSAVFRYNLLKLLTVIVNSLGEEAIGRFQRLLARTNMRGTLTVDEIKKLGNIVVWDNRIGRVTFDLDDVKF